MWAITQKIGHEEWSRMTPEVHRCEPRTSAVPSDHPVSCCGSQWITQCHYGTVDVEDWRVSLNLNIVSSIILGHLSPEYLDLQVELLSLQQQVSSLQLQQLLSHQPVKHERRLLLLWLCWLHRTLTCIWTTQCIKGCATTLKHFEYCDIFGKQLSSRFVFYRQYY